MAVGNIESALELLHVVFGSGNSQEVEQLIAHYESESIFTKEEAQTIRKKLQEAGEPPLGLFIEDQVKLKKAQEFRDYVLKICD